MRNLLVLLLCFAVGSGSLYGQCKVKPVVTSIIDPTGNSANKGRSIEGPACVEIYFNPLFGPIMLQTTETRTVGPDPSATLGKGSAKALGNDIKAQKSALQSVGTPPIQVEFDAIDDAFSADRKLVNSLSVFYNDAVVKQDQVIGDLKNLLNATMGIDPSTSALSRAVGGAAKTTLLAHLAEALKAQTDYQPSDKGEIPLLFSLQERQNELSGLPSKFSADWSDWYSNHKGGYDALVKNIQDAIDTAKQYATGSDNDKALKTKAGIVNFWKARLDALGIEDGATVDLLPFSVVRQEIRCSGVFNFNSSTAVSLVLVDERPTLTGSDPAIKTQDPFLMLTCGSRISVSAGAGFSTIRQKTFAIIKSTGGQDGAAINKFGTLSDSRFNPMPMALVHARLLDFAGNLAALHVTFGVAGNFQGQESGGSAAEFLIAPSLSIARAVYLSAGLHIGTRSQLAGGYNENDTVPAAITTLQGQVKRSYTTGFGFAISFTKP